MDKELQQIVRDAELGKRLADIERMRIEKDLQQGEVILLRRQLTRRFGPLPEWAEQRLTQARPEELEHWADRVLEVQTLAEIFGSSA